MDTASTSDEYQELLYSREEYEKRYTPEASSEEPLVSGVETRGSRSFRSMKETVVQTLFMTNVLPSPRNE
ncbi:hypothetical protein BWQ96_10252 [Gracilariopsis chorda]|uniref:Uncharacterized protein n=1 Tax=Gracilariopsis chorda TaxID=448386 RepID=A0A2V3IFT9_9FLOR|nr:hypothetical protein BWQ96_10252 [Gracilariopsis chorda]|eukprot:PXF40040.1 hypothetical protein BWQ96_10252 [Gracilariopsis chorda]